MANKVEKVIIDAIKREKCSILLGCTPDGSHQKQLSVIPRYT